ncbi:MAG: saccharopine dehydrogenase NADP-binding domain-containing protein [Balneolales bacterium]|nr:saccharopine dehydrogenase NADP-binding domain-containing protein [Balneolales bacterium]
MKNKTLLIYGSYGYSGSLITKECLKKNFKVILAGRNRAKLKAQANELNLESRLFDLMDISQIKENIKDADAVMHCAGPFIETSSPMIEACLETATHYLDITGEFEVIENAALENKMAREMGVVLMPGTGFDVVPSDCLALYSKNQLLSADKLKIYLQFRNGFSGGSRATAVQHFADGGAVRENGYIKRVGVAHKVRKMDFGDGKGDRSCITIPWGDISSAFHSTKTANIEVYLAANLFSAYGLKVIKPLSYTLKPKIVRRIVRRWVNRGNRGPSEAERKSGSAMIVAEVSTINSEKMIFLLKTPDPYELTAKTASDIAARVLNGEVSPGFRTPAMAFGEDYILKFEGVSRKLLGVHGMSLV